MLWAGVSVWGDGAVLVAAVKWIEGRSGRFRAGVAVMGGVLEGVVEDRLLELGGLDGKRRAEGAVDPRVCREAVLGQQQ
jgi:hypothetical protein